MLLKLAIVDYSRCCSLFIKIKQDFDFRSSSPHAAQFKLCRDVLENPLLGGCISSPLKDLTEMLVVGERKILEDASHPFQSWLAKEHLTVVQCKTADGFVLDQCVKYSLMVWLEEKQWYRVGQTIVKGSFLSGKPRNLDRMTTKVHCTSNGDVFLNVLPEIIRMYRLEQWELSEEGMSNGSSFQVKWATCLPKLGRGRVVAMHRSLPAHSPFESYRQMKAYWKNCYGYDLPVAEPEVYYDVLFNGSKNTFLYPFFCVLSGEPEQVMYKPSKEYLKSAMQAFQDDLISSSKVICGNKLLVSATTDNEARIQSIMRTVSVAPRAPSINKKCDKFSERESRVVPTISRGSLTASSSSVVRSASQYLGEDILDISDDANESSTSTLPVKSLKGELSFRPVFGHSVTNRLSDMAASVRKTEMIVPDLNMNSPIISGSNSLRGRKRRSLDESINGSTQISKTRGKSSRKASVIVD